MDVKHVEAQSLTPNRHSINCSYYPPLQYHKLVTTVAFTKFSSQAVEFSPSKTMPKAEAQNAFPRRVGRGTVSLLQSVSPCLSEGSDASYTWVQCLKLSRPRQCSGGAGFQGCSLGTLMSRLSFWKGEGVKKKGSH